MEVKNLPARDASESKPSAESLKTPPTSVLAKPGYEAQGWALAQSIIAVNRNVRSDLKRLIVQAFGLAQEARTAAMKALSSDLKTMTENVKATMPNVDKPQRISGTATVYASQCRTILKAMNAGMTKTVMLAILFPGEDVDVEETIASLGFDSILLAARNHNGSTASGRGRKADPWLVKMGKWLEKNVPAEDDDDGAVQYAKFVELYNSMVK